MSAADRRLVLEANAICLLAFAVAVLALVKHPGWFQ